MTDAPAELPEVVVADGPLALEGVVVRRPTVVRAGPSGGSVTSLRGAVLLAPLHVAEAVDLRDCSVAGAVGLEQLRLARSAFRRQGGRFVVGDASGVEYRALREAARASGLHTLAGDFHMGELDAARRAAPPRSLRRVGLEVYRVVAGYGHRPSRPLAVYVALIGAVTWLFHTFPTRFVGYDYRLGNNRVDYEHWPSVLSKLMLRMSLTPLSPIDPTGMHTDGYLLLIGVKLATVVLGVLLVMGVRSRLRR